MMRARLQRHISRCTLCRRACFFQSRHFRMWYTIIAGSRLAQATDAVMIPYYPERKADGSGYRFLAKQVLALDKINPQIAARLLNAFRSWRSLESKRRKLAEAALNTIVERPGISNDVYEIASKMVE